MGEMVLVWQARRRWGVKGEERGVVIVAVGVGVGVAVGVAVAVGVGVGMGRCRR